VTTFTDGASPSVTPEPEDGSDPRGGADHCERDDPDEVADTGSSWLRDEIERRIAAGRSGSGGRHARRDGISPGSVGYVPRHSVATPGPGAPRPGPVGGPVSPQPSELLRRERTSANGSRPAAWSGPPGRTDETAGRRPMGDGQGPALPRRTPGTSGSPPAPQQEPPTAPGADASAPAASASATAATAPYAITPPSAPPADTASTAPQVIPAAPPPAAPPADPPFDARAAVPAAPPAPPAGPPPSGQDLSGDPLFTARTPAPGSREREARAGLPLGTVSVPEQRGSDQPRGAGLPGVDDPDADLQSRRVRVVLAERKGVARPVRTVVDIQEGTGVGELLRSNLIGSQLAVALRFAVGAGLTLGLLPLLFAMVPEIGRMEVLGLRLPWLLLGVLVYPFLFGLGLWHTRTAERVEQNFADHVQG
jgi:hypothetical protein